MAQSDWIQTIDDMIRDHGTRGGFVVALPEYRPDQCQALAHALELQYFDFRQQVMAAHGWDADQLGFEDVDAALETLAATQGSLVNNVEALLATKEIDACARWLRQFLATPWERPLVVPIVIYTQELPVAHPRVHTINDGELPTQTFLNRLAM